MVAGSNPARCFLYFKTILFSQFEQNKTGVCDFIVHYSTFYTETVPFSVIAQAHSTCICNLSGKSA